MVGFLALFAIQVGVILLRRLITPKQKRPKAQPFDRPTSEDGAPIAKGFGMQELSGNMMLLKDPRVSEENDGARHRYWARIALAIGWGPFDVLYDILSDELALSLQRPGRNQSVGGSEPISTLPFPISLTGDGPVKFNIAALDMFGGGDEEGGLNGEVRFYRGTENQPLDPLIAYGYEQYASRYPYLAYICFGTAPDEETTSAQGSDFHWTANNPTPKPISVVVGSYPHGLVDQAAALGVTTYTNPRIGHDANPMEVIWECLTNRVWGASESPASFDIPNFIAAAERFLAEGKGISTTFVNQALDDFIDDVERHVRAMLVENPKTGLIQMQFLRADYEIVNLPVLTKANTFNLHQHEGHFLDTLNQIEVRYRKFAGGERGVFTDLLVTDSAVFTLYNTVFPGGFSSPGIQIGQLTWYGPGRRMVNVSATRTREAVTVELEHLVDYRFHADDGWFQFYSNPDTDVLMPGDQINVSFESVPTFTGFVDGTVSAQNLANLQITGSVRRESYDMAMFTQEILAQEYADFMKLMSGRTLAPITWNAHRNTSGLRAGDVVLANEVDYRLSNMPIRITKIGYGTLEDPALRFEGIEDVFGEQVGAFPFQPGHAVVTPGNDPGEITEVVVVTCLGGAIRIGLFATQPFNIEVIRADDADGTNAVVISPEGGLPPGTRYIDDPQTIGVTKFYRVRLIWPGIADGPMSDVVSCTAVAGDPGEPTDTPLTWVLSTSQTETEGTATLTINDPQLRLLSVQRNSQAGNGTPTAFETIGEPYTGTVALVAPALSYITFRITYVGLDGLDKVEDAVAIFDPNLPANPIPNIPDASGLVTVLPFHTTLTRGAVFGSADTGYPGADVVELAEFGRRRIDATGMDKCQGQTQVSHPLPSGAQVRWQYVPSLIENPVESDWAYLDGFTGPSIFADVITAIPMLSPVVSLALLARQDIVVRMVCVGGDAATPLGIKQALLTFLGGALAGGGEDDGGSAPGGPDPCEDTTENFGGYADVAAAETSGWTNVPDLTAGGGMALDLTGGVGGSRAIRMDEVPGPVGYTERHHITYEFTGLVPNASYLLSMDMKLDSGFATDPSQSLYQIAIAAAALIGFPSTPGGPEDARRFIGEFKPFTIDHSGTLLAFPASPTGTYTLDISFSSLLGAVSQPHSIWIDNIVIKAEDTGEIFNPCMGGPTLPGDGGYIPSDPGGPLPPALPPPDTGQRAVGVWGYPAPFTAYPPFYGVAKRFDLGPVLSELAQLRALGYRAMLDPVARPGSLVNGVFSLAKYMETLNKWTAIASAIADFQDVISGIMVVDEPFCAHCWGLSSPMQFSVVDGVMAKRISEIFPDYIPFIRVSGRRIKSTGQIPRYIRGCWNQMEGVQDGTRSVQEYMAMHTAAAKSLNLRWVWGLNLFNYGSSHGILTPAAIRANGIPMAQDQESHGVYLWAGIGVRGVDPSILQTAPYVSAWNDVIDAMTP